MKSIQSVMAKLLMCFALLLGGYTPASAQEGRSSADAVIGLFGALAKGISDANNRKSWDVVPVETRSCLDIALSPKNASVEGLIRSGVKVSDPRLSELMNFCQAVMARQLRENLPCKTQNDAGQMVQTLCYEQFVSVNGRDMRVIDKDTFISLATSGKPVQIATLEMPAAESNRLQAEQRSREQALADKRRLAEQKALADKKKAVAELDNFRPY